MVGPSNIPLEVPAAELVERERHRPDRVRDLVDVHRERVGHLAGGVEEDVDDVGERRLVVGAARRGRAAPPAPARFSSGVSGRSSAAAATE